MEIISTITPVNSQQFPVINMDDVKGGLHSVSTTTARDSIDTRKREEGMRVYVTAESKSYRLEGGITNSNWMAEDVVVDRYTHLQSSPSTTWSITHNLGRNPIVQTYTGDGIRVMGQEIITSGNYSLDVKFNTSISGTGYLT